jgi:hypothetical protein
MLGESVILVGEVERAQAAPAARQPSGALAIEDVVVGRVLVAPERKGRDLEGFVGRLVTARGHLVLGMEGALTLVVTSFRPH